MVPPQILDKALLLKQLYEDSIAFFLQEWNEGV
jgi:hypothetical protein